MSEHRSLENYVIGRTLGEGCFGKVKLGIDVRTGQKVALKLIEKKPDPTERDRVTLEREIKIMKFLKHQNIVELFDVFEIPEKQETCLVLEYVSGGELFDYITSNGRLTEKESIRLFRQMISAIEYTHHNLVVHRDLKPENILLDENLNVKISDFGLSNLMSVGIHMHSVCGSPHYTPPELHKRQKYIGPEVDIWAMGVVLFAMVCGYLPWGGRTLAEQIKSVISATFQVPSFITSDCSDLISRMLDPNPATRANLQEIRHHAWVNRGYNSPPSSTLPPRGPLKEDEIDQEIIKNLEGLGFSGPSVINNLVKGEITKQDVVMYYLFRDQIRRRAATVTRRNSAPDIGPRTSSRKLVRTDSEEITPKTESEYTKKTTLTTSMELDMGLTDSPATMRKKASLMKLIGVQLTKHLPGRKKKPEHPSYRASSPIV